MKSLYIIFFLCLFQYSLCQSDICSLPLEGGECRALFFRYGYNSNEKRCVEFMYGGCHGNANNFKTLKECQKACPSPDDAPSS